MGFFTKLVVFGAAVAGAQALLSNARSSNATAAEQSPDAEKDEDAREVYIVTSEVDISGVKISKAVHQYLVSRFGVSEAAVSHWGILLVDNKRKQAVQYDLMSEKVPNNRLRARKVVPRMLEEWTSADYVGVTTKTDKEIVQFGEQFMLETPTYDIIVASCQTFVSRLLTYICNVHVIDEASLEAVVNKAGPNVALFFAITSHLWDVIAQVGRAHIAEFKAIKNAIEEADIFK